MGLLVVDQVIFAYANAGPEMLRGDVVEHENQWWLVPRWLINTSVGKRQPERMIAIASFLPQPTKMGGCRWMLRQPMPKFLFDDPAPKVEGTIYAVLLSPDVWFPLPSSEPKQH